VTLDVEPAGTGSIRISTLHPDTYPWQGVYFDGVPVKIEAVANEGYFFSHWTANGLIQDVTDELFLDTLSANDALFEAHFMPVVTTGISERTEQAFSLYPNPATAEIFITNSASELANARFQVVDLSGRVVLEGSLQQAQGRAFVAVGSLNNGSYHIHLIAADGTSSARPFVKL